MKKDTVVDIAGRAPVGDVLTELLRNGAQELIRQAVEAELRELLDQHATRRTEDGRAGVVRSGYLPERELQTGVGPVTVRIPKVRAKTGKPVTFRSALVPPYVRKTKSLVFSLAGILPARKRIAFLLPILDHCLADAFTPGVKAILVYPMNALATDQAGRIARLIHDNAKLRGRLTAGLYIGEYGSGKTHLLMHLAERALADDRPVFWLNLERMNLDLGNPARHLHRLLEHSVLPVRRRPSALERASVWTRSKGKLRALLNALEEIAEGDTEEAAGAKKALRIAGESDDPGHALEVFLAGLDIEDKSGGSYRRDAYRRILLWVDLLERLEGTRGAVVLIDEAENLYTSGVPWSARRTALRSLAFYCGGAIPGAAVVMAMTSLRPSRSISASRAILPPPSGLSR